MTGTVGASTGFSSLTTRRTTFPLKLLYPGFIGAERKGGGRWCDNLTIFVVVCFKPREFESQILKPPTPSIHFHLDMTDLMTYGGFDSFDEYNQFSEFDWAVPCNDEVGFFVCPSPAPIHVMAGLLGCANIVGCRPTSYSRGTPHRRSANWTAWISATH